MSFLTHYCHITKDSCHVNGRLFARYQPESADLWFKQIYKEIGVTYPKFYKMDMLAQSGFLSSELIKLMHAHHLADYADDEIGLLFANQFSSGDTDERFRNSYAVQQTPSPSLFVYTLPNIVLGEIAIANKWYGENMFAVLPKFTPEFYVRYAEVLFATGSKAIIGGWLDISDQNVNIFSFLLEKYTSDIKFNTVNLLHLAESQWV